MSAMPSGPQRLRHEVVRWVPTRAELERRPPILLTERDAQIIRAVAVHGYLSADLIALAYFPRERSRPGPSSSAHDRLRRLWLWRFLERLELPVARALGGRRPYVYTLGPAGISVAEQALGAQAASIARPRLDRLDLRTFDHDRHAMVLWANLSAKLRDGPLRLGRWVPERTLRSMGIAVRDPVDGTRRGVLPDALFRLDAPDGHQEYWFVEVDMGTHTLDSWRRKVRALAAYLHSGRFAEQWHHDRFDVVVVTMSAPRLRHLRCATNDALGASRDPRYLFATGDVLQHGRFAEARWSGPNGSLHWPPWSAPIRASKGWPGDGTSK